MRIRDQIQRRRNRNENAVLENNIQETSKKQKYNSRKTFKYKIENMQQEERTKNQNENKTRDQ